LKEEIKAGIIIIASLAILSSFIILIGGSQLFEKYDKYYIKIMNTAGLETGAQVRLGGVRVGRVTDVNPPSKPGEPVTVEIGVKKGTALYKGTKALITQIGFVGDIYLLLAVDSTINERIKVGDVIPTEEKVEFDLLMAKMNTLSQSVDSLIKDMDKLFSQKNIKGIETLIGNTNNAIVSGSSNLEKISINMKDTAGKLERVLNEVEDLIRTNKGEVTQLIKKTREDIEKAGEMIKSIESTARSVEKTSKSADKAIDLQSRNLENLIGTMTKTTEELQELLQEIRHKPWSVIYKEKKGD
jgi:phospholipid/cholesterol/gamma-HCH transport system substrate-binding protein